LYNNCPYKVRRFNWYRIPITKHLILITASDLGKMVLNPDVTVKREVLWRNVHYVFNGFRRRNYRLN